MIGYLLAAVALALYVAAFACRVRCAVPARRHYKAEIRNTPPTGRRRT